VHDAPFVQSAASCGHPQGGDLQGGTMVVGHRPAGHFTGCEIDAGRQVQLFLRGDKFRRFADKPQVGAARGEIRPMNPERFTLSPSRISDIAHAALVLNGIWK
jgi:hypothetical protein